MTGREAVRIRRYRPGDGPAINRGFERIFGKARELDDWEWKFPVGERENTILIAEEDGEVLAHFAAIPVSLRVEGRRIRAGQVVDVYSVRRQGLFLRLVDRFYEELCGPGGLELIYGFPGERHFRLGVRRLRYSEPVPVRFWSRRVQPEVGPADHRGRQILRKLRRGWGARASGVSVRRGFDPALVDRLWERASPRFPVCAVRDRTWIEHRFVDRPGVEYLHRTIWRGGEPAALAVLRLEAGGWRAGTEPQDLHLGAVSFLPDLDPLEVCRRLYLTMGDADLV